VNITYSMLPGNNAIRVLTSFMPAKHSETVNLQIHGTLTAAICCDCKAAVTFQNSIQAWRSYSKTLVISKWKAYCVGSQSDILSRTNNYTYLATNETWYNARSDGMNDKSQFKTCNAGLKLFYIVEYITANQEEVWKLCLFYRKWRLYITLGNTEFLDFVHRLQFCENATLRKLDCFRLQVKGWEASTQLSRFQTRFSLRIGLPDADQSAGTQQSQLWKLRRYGNLTAFTGYYAQCISSPAELELSRRWLKSTTFWVVTSCSLVGVHRHFGGTHRVHLQGRRVRQARRGRQAEPASCWFLAWLTLQLWTWRRYITPKRRWTPTEVHGVTVQKIVLSACSFGHIY
jgi:hypothetical protein